MHDGGHPRDLGEDVGHTGRLSTCDEGRMVWGKDLHDAIIDYSIEVLGIPVAHELETTPESIVSGVKGRRYRERWRSAHAISPRKSKLN